MLFGGRMAGFADRTDLKVGEIPRFWTKQLEE
jgi:hypothetical protein